MSATVRDENRDQTMVALYKGGATMQEVADISGIRSRERVRQILKRNGVSGDDVSRSIDPLRVIATCRSPGVANWEQALAAADYKSPQYFKHAVASFGMTESIERLFRWRTGARRRGYAVEKRVELIQQYRDLAKRLGHTPTNQELCPKNGVPFWAIFYKHFATIRELRIAAGIDARELRGRKQELCKRGHQMAETRNKWGTCGECRKLRRRTNRKAEAV